jgi:hypothetical protein
MSWDVKDADEKFKDLSARGISRIASMRWPGQAMHVSSGDFQIINLPLLGEGDGYKIYLHDGADKPVSLIESRSEKIPCSI